MLENVVLALARSRRLTCFWWFVVAALAVLLTLLAVDMALLYDRL